MCIVGLTLKATQTIFVQPWYSSYTKTYSGLLQSHLMETWLENIKIWGRGQTLVLLDKYSPISCLICKWFLNWISNVHSHSSTIYLSSLLHRVRCISGKWALMHAQNSSETHTFLSSLLLCLLLILLYSLPPSKAPWLSGVLFLCVVVPMLGYWRQLVILYSHYWERRVHHSSHNPLLSVSFLLSLIDTDVAGR